MIGLDITINTNNALIVANDYKNAVGTNYCYLNRSSLKRVYINVAEEYVCVSSEDLKDFIFSVEGSYQNNSGTTVQTLKLKSVTEGVVVTSEFPTLSSICDALQKIIKI